MAKKTWKVPAKARTKIKPGKAPRVAKRSLKASTANGKAKTAKPRSSSSPRSQALPGMEQQRNVKLDNVCEGIADERRVMNAAKVEERGLIQSALQLMQQKGIQVYKHGGVELARVPGSESLRVRLTKQTGDADETDLEPAEETTRPEPEFDVDTDGAEIH
jgi:hypothetical protein